jgi:hypothetical protein
MSAARSEPAPAAPTAWTWPHPPRTTRYGATITEVVDTASGGRRVAVIENALWPPVGTEITVYEDDTHVRRGAVSKVELVLDLSRPARVVISADLVRDPA